MKLIVNNKVLQKALKKIGTVVPKKVIVPALEHIMVTAQGNQLTIKATNLEVTMFYQLVLNDNASKDDTALINFHWLKGISDLHGEEPIFIEALKTYTSVTTSSGDYRQDAACKLKEFPVLPEVPETESVEMIPGFVKWLSSASILIDPRDEFNKWKSSVYLEIINNHLILTSTNAHQLFTHTFDIESELNRSIMISQTVVKSLDGFEETKLFLNDDLYAFTSEGVTIISKLPDGKFADYNKLIPIEDPHNCAIDRVELKDLLDKVKFINPDACSIQTGADKLTINVKNESGQTAVLHINLSKSYTGEVMELGINPSDFQLLLTQTDYDTIGLSFQDKRKAFILTNTKDLSYVGLIMPLMTN